MKKNNIYIRIAFLLFAAIAFQMSCKKSSSGGSGGGGTPPTPTPTPTANTDVAFWASKADQTILLQKQTDPLALGAASTTTQTITIDSTQTYQTVDGFGYTLTGGSATLINSLPAATKSSLLNELFGTDATSIGVSYLRISIGASDLSASVFSYDDMPAAQTDVNLNNFTLSQDTVDLIPLLKQIIAINPNIKILGSPWSPPAWMKDNGSPIAGGLQTQYYGVYAKYFVKYIQAMKAKGITIDAVTLQNEPQNPSNNPSMVMSATQEATFVKNNLGPEFQTAGLTTKIIVWDHNCDNANYPITVLGDAAARTFIDGSAFHLYAGDISALSSVHAAYPNKNLYFTEQYTASTGSFSGDFMWHIKNVMIGAMVNWSKNALEWNLANDINFNPHTTGGCNTCKGGLTIDGSNVIRNVGYYIVAQISKFVPAGSVHIASSTTGSLANVAFKTPAGKNVVLVLNDGAAPQTIILKTAGRSIPSYLPAGTVGTYVW